MFVGLSLETLDRPWCVVARQVRPFVRRVLACCVCFLLGMREVQGIRVLHDILTSLDLMGCSGWLSFEGAPGMPLEVGGCYLVDPTSSHMIVSKIKPCMSKYELIQTVKLRMAH